MPARSRAATFSTVPYLVSPATCRGRTRQRKQVRHTRSSAGWFSITSDTGGKVGGGGRRLSRLRSRPRRGRCARAAAIRAWQEVPACSARNPSNPCPTRRPASPAPPSPPATSYMRMRDALGTIYEDAAFAPLFPPQGQPGRGALAAGPGHGRPVRRGPLRPPGRGRGPRPDRLEVRPRPAPDRCRASTTPSSASSAAGWSRARRRTCCWRRSWSGAAELGLLKAHGPPAHRLHPRAGGRAGPQPPGAGAGDAAPHPRRPRRRRPGLAARPRARRSG